MLTKNAIHFIHIFAPIISKAAMQTYLSAFPLMPSESLLFMTLYSATVVQSCIKLSASASRRSICRMIYDPRVIRSNTGSIVYDTTSSYDAIPLALSKSGASRIGNKFQLDYFFAISPNGQWIVNKDRKQCSLDIWNVRTRSCARTIEEGSFWDLDRITFSADGKKIMFINTLYLGLRAYIVWDVTTETLVKRLEVSKDVNFAISPDGSKVAVANRSDIQIIDIITGQHIGKPTMTPYASDETCHLTDSFIWSPNGQFLVSVIEDRPFTKAEIYLLSFGDSIKLLNPCMESRISILDLACSPNSSKVAAIYGDLIDSDDEKILAISCTLTGNLIRTTSFTLASTKVRIAFTSDENILICGYDSDRGTNVLLRFKVVPITHFIQINAQYPPKFHPSETPPIIIEYPHDTSGAVIDYASQVDADGWILDTKGKRQMWTPWANHELLCSCNPPQEGQTKYRTLNVKDPETRSVVLRYVIAFEQLGDANQGQETSASVE